MNETPGSAALGQAGRWRQRKSGKTPEFLRALKLL